MTGSEGSSASRLEVAGRRYSQDTLLDSDSDFDAQLTEKYPSNLLSGSSTPQWAEVTYNEVRKRIRIPYFSNPLELLKSALYFLIPSYLASHTSLEFKKYKPGSTEWLDGLRGIAAFFVFVYHHVVAYTGEEHDFAWDPKRHPHWLHLPILRLFYSGTPMVKIFFVISGFALTYKPVKLMRKPGSQGALMKTLASSIFRRWQRLFLPCAAVFFMVHCLRAWGAFDWFEVRHLKNAKILPGDIERYPAKSPDGFWGQMGIMVTEFWLFSVRNPILHAKYEFDADKHMWTIPTEYMGSMALFLLVAMVAHIRRSFRVYVVLPACYIFWTYYAKYDYPLFICGYFCAEIHAAMDIPSLLPSVNEDSIKKQTRSFKKTGKTIFFSFMFFVGLWLLSFPTRDGDKTWGYMTLCQLMNPSGYFTKRATYHSLGACVLVWALLYLPRLQSYLTLPLFQYLGRISFSLYLMHGAYGSRMFIVVAVFLFAVFPLVMWMSDVFWRLVEAPCTNFVRWSEQLVVAKEDGVKEQAGQIKSA
ncbi:hypothetical protein TWF970_004482 [Orbilia oligospora]|uniref:Acyltransferase 3 domain-containing protein n=1 Tax=Orbilia oligospora TaxID=2813651 RepID=A0A7C8RD95_ORBOL|nr:hypothetical protein TWF970_004482 [Orbilia oligospora]